MLSLSSGLFCLFLALSLHVLLTWRLFQLGNLFLIDDFANQTVHKLSCVEIGKKHIWSSVRVSSVWCDGMAWGLQEGLFMLSDQIAVSGSKGSLQANLNPELSATGWMLNNSPWFYQYQAFGTRSMYSMAIDEVVRSIQIVPWKLNSVSS
jgi:hypothetical protein